MKIVDNASLVDENALDIAVLDDADDDDLLQSFEHDTLA